MPLSATVEGDYRTFTLLTFDGSGAGTGTTRGVEFMVEGDDISIELHWLARHQRYSAIVYRGNVPLGNMRVQNNSIRVFHSALTNGVDLMLAFGTKSQRDIEANPATVPLQYIAIAASGVFI